MCEPTTIALTMSALTTATTYVASQKAANKQEGIAAQQAANEQAALDLRQQQINEQAADKMSDRARQARRERARARTVSGESGISGNLADAILNNISFQEGTDIASIQKNRDNAEAQNDSEKRSARVRYDSHIAGIDRMSGLEAGLQFAGDGVDAYSAYKKGKRQASLAVF